MQCLEGEAGSLTDVTAGSTNLEGKLTRRNYPFSSVNIPDTELSLGEFEIKLGLLAGLDCFL